jgi:hypothetical protein
MTTILNNDVLSVISSYITPYTKNKQLQIYINKKNKIIIKNYGFSEKKDTILFYMKEYSKREYRDTFNYCLTEDEYWNRTRGYFTIENLVEIFKDIYPMPDHRLSGGTIRRCLKQMEGLHVSRVVGCYGLLTINGEHYWRLIERKQTDCPYHTCLMKRCWFYGTDFDSSIDFLQKTQFQ